MRFGLKTHQHQLTWPELSSRVRYGEEHGFDGAWLFDHLKAMETEANERLRVVEATPTERGMGRPLLYGAEHLERVAEIYRGSWSRGGNPTAESPSGSA